MVRWKTPTSTSCPSTSCPASKTTSLAVISDLNQINGRIEIMRNWARHAFGSSKIIAKSRDWALSMIKKEYLVELVSMWSIDPWNRWNTSFEKSLDGPRTYQHMHSKNAPNICMEWIHRYLHELEESTPQEIQIVIPELIMEEVIFAWLTMIRLYSLLFVRCTSWRRGNDKQVHTSHQKIVFFDHALVGDPWIKDICSYTPNCDDILWLDYISRMMI